MGGTSSSTQQSNQTAQTTPWDAAAPQLQGVLGAFNPSIANINGTPAINQAYSTLEANAQAPNPYAAPAGAATLSQLGGGGNYGTASNIVTGGANTTANALSPYTSGNATDPNSNPALASQLATVGQDVSNNVNPLFSAAGRLGSPSNAQALARGITQGSAPILQNAAQNQISAAGVGAGAANQAGGVLGGLDTGNSNIQTAGINNAPGAFTLPSLGAEQLLAAGTQQQQQPIATAGALSGILGPLAAQFGTTNQTGSQTGTQTMSPMQQLLMGSQIFGNVFGGQGSGAAGNASKLIFG